jgi:hypothetical protein
LVKKEEGEELLAIKWVSISKCTKILNSALFKMRKIGCNCSSVMECQTLGLAYSQHMSNNKYKSRPDVAVQGYNASYLGGTDQESLALWLVMVKI